MPPNPSTVLGRLNGLAARTGAAVLAVAHNPEPALPKAARSMRRLIPAASAVFTTALAGPNRRRVLVPLRPSMDDAPPPIPYALTSTTVTWRKPIQPWRLNLMVENGGKQLAVQRFLMRALAKGPQPASRIKLQAAQLGISRYRLEQACAFNNVQSSRVSADGGAHGAGA